MVNRKPLILTISCGKLILIAKMWTSEPKTANLHHPAVATRPAGLPAKQQSRAYCLDSGPKLFPNQYVVVCPACPVWCWCVYSLGGAAQSRL